jgi:hypothetical protein
MASKILSSHHGGDGGGDTVCGVQSAALASFQVVAGLLEYTPDAVPAVEAEQPMNSPPSITDTEMRLKLKAELRLELEAENRLEATPVIEESVAALLISPEDKDNVEGAQPQEPPASPKRKNVDSGRDSPKAKRTKVDSDFASDTEMHAGDTFHLVQTPCREDAPRNTYVWDNKIGALMSASFVSFTGMAICHGANEDECNQTESFYLKDFNDVLDLLVIEAHKEFGENAADAKANAQLFKGVITAWQPARAITTEMEVEMLYTTWTRRIISRLDEIIAEPDQAIENMKKPAH